MKITASFTSIFHEALLCVLMLPLLFININNFHDWGDDFAQYILQAEVLTRSIPELPVTDTDSYSPGTKGLLFSILLAPAVVFSPEILTAGKILVSLSLIFCGLMFFKILNQKFNAVTALIITLFFVYNCHVLRLKDEVLPDLLFTGITLAVFLLINTEKPNKVVAGLLLAGISTGFKSIGFVLVLTLAIGILTGIIKIRENKKLTAVLWLLVPCILILILEKFSSQNKSGAVWYASITFSGFDSKTFINNFFIYRDAISLVFEQEVPLWINKTIKYFMFAGLAGGLILQIIRKSPVLPAFMILYVAAILIYPYNREPVRFIIPLIPFVLIFMFDFYSGLCEFFFKKKIAIIPAVIALAFAGSQVKTTYTEISTINAYEPWSADSREMIAFIEKKLLPEHTVAFQKPWALAFFSGKHCVPADAAYRAGYVVFRNSVADPEQFSTKMPSSVVFKNREYKIIKTK